MTDFFTPDVLLNAIDLVLDYLLVLFFFHKLESVKGKRALLGYAALALLAFLYLHTSKISDAASAQTGQNFLDQTVRYLVYVFCVGAFLNCTKGLRLRQALYLSLFYSVFYMCFRNFNTYGRVAVQVNGIAAGNTAHLMLTAGITLPKFLVAWLTADKLPLEKIQGNSSVKWVSMSFLCGLGLILKFSMITILTMDFSGLRVMDAVIYPVAAMSSTYIMAFLLEKQFAEQEQGQKFAMENQRQKYELSNARRMQQNADDVRRIYHDMKNHLLMIRSLQSTGQAVEYADQVLNDMSGYENAVRTGNETIDRLLQAKAEQGAADSITFNVCADFSGLDEIPPMDLISIFGNAVDNAMEAVRQLEEKDRRIVFIKSSGFAGAVVTRISNTYAGPIKKENGRLLTTKADSAGHGIGTGSIYRAAERNGGTVSYEIDEEKKRFSLMVSLPCKKD